MDGCARAGATAVMDRLGSDPRAGPDRASGGPRVPGIAPLRAELGQSS